MNSPPLFYELKQDFFFELILIHILPFTWKQSSGALIAASRYGGATPIPPHIFLRGTICQGVSTVVASVFGVTGCTVSV